VTYGPEEFWFRPPKLVEMCRRGDRLRFLWIAEPVLGKISGVGYEITETLATESPDTLDRAHAIARAELDRRITSEETIPEGSLWDAVEWQIPPQTRPSL
jgi:hypothetical protein